MWGIEALDADGNGKHWPDFMKKIPYHWIEPGTTGSFADAPAEVLASGQAADLARYRALVIDAMRANSLRLTPPQRRKSSRPSRGECCTISTARISAGFRSIGFPADCRAHKIRRQVRADARPPDLRRPAGKVGPNKIIAGSLTAADAEGGRCSATRPRSPSAATEKAGLL
jgi:hypothetical protein